MSAIVNKISISEPVVSDEAGKNQESLKKQNTQITQEFEIKKVIQSVVKILKNILTTNMGELLRKNSLGNEKIILENVFFCKHLPLISIEDYLLRIIDLAEINTSTLILASIYIDRFCERTKFVMIPYNIYR